MSLKYTELYYIIYIFLINLIVDINLIINEK